MALLGCATQPGLGVSNLGNKYVSEGPQPTDHEGEREARMRRRTASQPGSDEFTLDACHCQMPSVDIIT